MPEDHTHPSRPASAPAAATPTDDPRTGDTPRGGVFRRRGRGGGGGSRAARLAWFGGIILAVMMGACLLSLPWTFGVPAAPVAAVAPADAGGTEGEAADGAPAPAPPGRPRYAAGDLDLTLLPPSWWPHSEAERARVESWQAVSRLSKADAAGGAAEESIARPTRLFGTDALGRDVFTRVLAGGGISLLIGLAAAGISVFIGTMWGMIAGFAGGRTDAVMMRIVDVLYGLPYILLVVLIAVGIDGVIDRQVAAAVARAEASGGLYRPSGVTAWLEQNALAVNVMTLLIAIGGVSWLTMARVIRGQVLSLREQPFMEAARALGVPVPRQFLRHLLPNLLGPIIVYATLTVPQAILQESFLSFLGIGIQEPLPSWGNLAADGLNQLNPVASRWWLLFWPCLFLGLTLIALNFIGEGLREAFDPRRRQRGGAPGRAGPESSTPGAIGPAAQ